MPDTMLKPSRRLRDIVKGYGAVGTAARAFGLHQVTLDRFMSGTHGLSGDSIAAILKATEMPFEDLFEHVEERR